MRLGRRLLLFLLFLALLAGVLFALSPYLIGAGLRLYAGYQSRHQGLRIQLGRISAPYFRPVEIENIRIRSEQACTYEVDFTIERAQFSLDWLAFFRKRGEQPLQYLTLLKPGGEIRRRAGVGERCQFDWEMIHSLLPAGFTLQDLRLRVVDDSTEVLLEGVNLTASQYDAGHFSAGTVAITSPLFKQRFTGISGPASWENQRLTLAALRLGRDLQLETISGDLSQLGQSRVRFEIHLDAFGGEVRASVSRQQPEEKVTWDIAGSAANVSFAELLKTIGLREPAAGTLRASKFTFRGDVRDLANATGSIWMEVNALSWRARRAEVLMLGASLYNREIHVAQLYLKQRSNELTLSGEYALPTDLSMWLQPSFRSDISATVNDLGEFAELVGLPAKNFAGTLRIEGSMREQLRDMAGTISIRGESLKLFGAPVASLRARLSIDGAELTLTALEARNLRDSVDARGRIDFAAPRQRYTAELSGQIESLTPYAGAFPPDWPVGAPKGSLRFTWHGNGTAGEHKGDFRLSGAGLAAASLPGLPPLAAEVDAVYDPARLELRRIELKSDRHTLTAQAAMAGREMTIERLELRDDDAALPARGTVRFEENNRALAEFVPLAPLPAAGLQTEDCLAALDLTPAAPLAGGPAPGALEKISLSGTWFADDWTATLVPQGSGSATVTPSTVRICWFQEGTTARLYAPPLPDEAEPEAPEPAATP